MAALAAAVEDGRRFICASDLNFFVICFIVAAFRILAENFCLIGEVHGVIGNNKALDVQWCKKMRSISVVTLEIHFEAASSTAAFELNWSSCGID